MEPALRRENERSLVEEYHAQVCAHLERMENEGSSSTFEFETCWQEYIDGGFGRWAWFVGGFDIFFGGARNAAMCQYFHDQLAAFARDHIQDPQNAPMPRI